MTQIIDDEITIHGYASDRLKPCPFCESTNLEVRRSCGSYWFHFVRCLKCDAEGPHIRERGNFDESAKLACQDWNTR